MGVSHPAQKGSGKAEAVTTGVCLETPLLNYSHLSEESIVLRVVSLSGDEALFSSFFLLV